MGGQPDGVNRRYYIPADYLVTQTIHSAMPVRIAERSIALHQRLAWTTAAIAAAASRELSQQGETIVVYCPAMMWRSYVPGPTHKARNSWAVPTESKRLFDDHRPDHA